jgi:O-antigen/teichoic acid export membrane protein
MKLFDKNLDATKKDLSIYINIGKSFFFRILGMLFNFLTIPITLRILKSNDYGIWVTIFSVVSWITLMDVGIGSGFRIKFTEEITKKNYERAGKYLQTFYLSTSLLALVITVIILIFFGFFDFKTLLNLQSNSNLDLIFLISLLSTNLLFLLKNISAILLSIHKSSTNNFILFLNNFIVFLLMLIGDKLLGLDFFKIASIYLLTPLFVYAIFNLYVFKKHLSWFNEKIFKWNSYDYLKNILNLGWKYFVIQIAIIVMFSSNNLIISRFLGSSEVTNFNILMQLFSTALFAFSIITTPYWSAFTEAITINDYVWIRSAIKKLLLFWIFFSFSAIIFSFFIPIITELWLKTNFHYNKLLICNFVFYAILLSYCSVFSIYLAGVGKLKISYYNAIFQILTNLPITYFLVKILNLGLTGIIVSININLLITSILLSTQVNKLINNKSHGIWSK